MARVYVSIGSNIGREQNIRSGVAELRAGFGELILSSVYESEAVGFAGDSFYNLVAGFDTALAPQQVAEQLRAIEERHGRVRNGPRFSSRTLDIDLLLYDDLVLHEGKLDIPRDEITRNAFVLWPLAEIAPQLKHPELGTSYAVLWESFDKASQPLWPVPFSF
jgi:2-amino-4-hydroxy-6-hydroxymethyldihydropteridine diphosphokinase